METLIRLKYHFASKRSTGLDLAYSDKAKFDVFNQIVGEGVDLPLNYLKKIQSGNLSGLTLTANFMPKSGRLVFSLPYL